MNLISRKLISGYVLTIVCIATLTIEECACKETQNPIGTNATARMNVGSAIHEKDDVDEEEDFVPYQGERFNVFDWMIFRTMGTKQRGNLLISPISIKMALVLLYEGAQDQTAYELAGVMQLPASRSATRDKFSTILRSLQTISPLYTLNVGTRIYVDSNVLIRQRYEATVKTFYETDVIKKNLSETHEVTEMINAWVSNITDGNIDRLIDDENSIKDSVMLITNALYFKGAWRRKYFSPENTKIGQFRVNINETVDVPFMKCFGRFYYSESAELDAKILRIPYDGHKFAMYLILPNSANGTDRLINEINPFILTRHVWLMQDLPIDVSIPKFNFDFTSHLEPVLREMGIRDIFDDTATLTGIARTKRTSKRLKVSDVLQKTGIEVNENGTLAYAATEIQLGNKIEDTTFHAHHPFVFYIEDESTGTIIYVGKITNPLDSSGSADHDPKQEFASKFGEGVQATAMQPGLNAADRDNFFNVNFFQILNEEEEQGNLISSPASAKMALTMLAEGAVGTTREELVSALRLPVDQIALRKVAKRIFAPLKRSENGTEIDAAARFWLDQSLQILKTYKDDVDRYYKGEVENINFMDTQASNVISEWIRRTTRNKLSSSTLNKPISPDTRLVLTSVMYMKGKWLKSFDKTKTKLRCFYVPNKGCKETHFLEHESIYRYAYIPSLDAQIIELPYSDRKTSMLALMPFKKENDLYLRTLSQDLSFVPVSALLANLMEIELSIRIPKFTIESKLDLRPTLKRLGVETIFNSNANLSKMTTEKSLRVTSILQNAKIEIDEEGTLAAADTEIVYALLSSSGIEKITLDRPFLFMIVDSLTNTTLFSGRFIQPNL